MFIQLSVLDTVTGSEAGQLATYFLELFPFPFPLPLLRLLLLLWDLLRDLCLDFFLADSSSEAVVQSLH